LPPPDGRRRGAANGIGLSPDGERLYASDYARRHVLTMERDGTGRDGPGTDVLITTIGTLFRGRSEVAGVPVAPAAI
jgi:hypothetical protein